MTRPTFALAWLGAFVAVALSAAVWMSWPTRTAPQRAVAPGAAAPEERAPDGIGGAPPVPAGSREEALDQVEAAETETFGAEEAARRRRQRERMLDLRAQEH